MSTPLLINKFVYVDYIMYLSDMEKEFVPYERALRLKVLGFDEPCLFGFDNCSTPMRCSDLRTNDQKFNGVNYNSSTYTSQPTFSQAFRWFREKHNLFGCIDLHPSKPVHWFIRVDDVIENDYIYHSENEGLKFGTYEMGELACLDKLIELTFKSE